MSLTPSDSVRPVEGYSMSQGLISLPMPFNVNFVPVPETREQMAKKAAKTATERKQLWMNALAFLGGVGVGVAIVLLSGNPTGWLLITMVALAVVSATVVGTSVFLAPSRWEALVFAGAGVLAGSCATLNPIKFLEVASTALFGLTAVALAKKALEAKKEEEAPRPPQVFLLTVPVVDTSKKAERARDELEEEKKADARKEHARAEDKTKGLSSEVEEKKKLEDTQEEKH